MSKKMPLRFSERVWLLGNEGYPFFLITGDAACALVEGSLSCMASSAMAQIKSIGPLPPLRYLVVAHEHSDHVCGFVALKKQCPDLILAGSQVAAEILAKEKVMTKFVMEDKVFGDVLFGLKLAEASPEMLPPEPMKLDMILEPDQVLDLGGAQLRAIATPGHSPGGLSFFVEPDRTLLISDAAGLGKSQTEIYPMFFYNFSEHVESLKKLKTFRPARLALGHDLVVEGEENCQDFLDTAVQASYAMRDDMKEQLRQGRSQAEVALDWAHRMHAFGLFEIFPDEALLAYTNLLIRRALEA